MVTEQEAKNEAALCDKKYANKTFVHNGNNPQEYLCLRVIAVKKLNSELNEWEVIVDLQRHGSFSNSMTEPLSRFLGSYRLK